MEFSKESMADQVQAWYERITLFRDKCPHHLEAEGLNGADDPVVMEKKASLAATKKAIKQENQVI